MFHANDHPSSSLVLFLFLRLLHPNNLLNFWGVGLLDFHTRAMQEIILNNALRANRPRAPTTSPESTAASTWSAQAGTAGSIYPNYGQEGVVSDVIAEVPSLYQASIADVVVKMFGLWGMESELKQLRKLLVKIKLVYKDGERQMSRKELVGIWMEEVKEAAHCLDEMSFEVQRLHKLLQKGDMIKINLPLFRPQIVSKLNKLVDKLQALVGEASEYGLKHEENSPFSRPQTSSSVAICELFGRDKEKGSLINWLLGGDYRSARNYSVFGIEGVGGIGKTTLAELAFHDQIVKDEFDLRCWVSMAGEFTYRRLLADMFTFVTGYNHHHTSPACLLHKIENMVSGKKCLLVLDDVRSVRDKDWVHLKATLSLCGRGSIVLVTTRFHDVLRAMNCLSIYKLECLDDASSWGLFRNEAFGQTKVNAGLEVIGRRIVQKCKGVPLVIKVLASMLRESADEEKWLNILASNFWSILAEDYKIDNLEGLKDLLSENVRRQRNPNRSWSGREIIQIEPNRLCSLQMASILLMMTMTVIMARIMMIMKEILELQKGAQ